MVERLVLEKKNERKDEWTNESNILSELKMVTAIHDVIPKLSFSLSLQNLDF